MKKEKLRDILLSLEEYYNEYGIKPLSLKNLWYWDYYKSIESELKSSEERRKIYQQIYHLERFGFLDNKGLTPKGFARFVREKYFRNNKKGKWDKKWRIVIFDIPERKRHVRNYFRDSIKNLGFKLLQNSTWVSPYGDFDEIQNLAKYYKLEKYIVLIIADRISNDILFKKKFNIEL